MGEQMKTNVHSLRPTKREVVLTAAGNFVYKKMLENVYQKNTLIKNIFKR